MTPAREALAWQALRSAWIFLSRWRDQVTVESREDMAQQAAVIAWQQHGSMRDPARLSALVRTVCRRLRYRTIVGRRRRLVVSLDAENELARRIPDDSGEGVEFEVAGNMVSRSWMLGQLGHVLGYQSPLNRAILMAYYQGFSCSELADRYQMPKECVKVRLYRSRRRVRREFEARIGRSPRRASW